MASAHFADLEPAGGDVLLCHVDDDSGEIGDRTVCHNRAAALAVWATTVARLYPGIDLAKLAVFVRIDEPRPISARTARLDRARFGPPGASLDQYSTSKCDA